MKKELNVLLVASYINIFGFGFLGPIYALYVKEIGGSILDASISWAIYSLVMGILIIVLGKLEKKIHDKKKMIVVGYFLLSIGILFYAFVERIFQLFLVQIFNGIAVAILEIPFHTIFSKDEDKGKKELEWAIWDGGEKIMAAASAIIGGIIVTTLGFNMLFIIMFFMQFFAALISINILQKKHSPTHKK